MLRATRKRAIANAMTILTDWISKKLRIEHLRSSTELRVLRALVTMFFAIEAGVCDPDAVRRQRERGLRQSYLMWRSDGELTK